ncbi:MAG: hypothetical protein LQ338_006821 [Usnochroma carphineum]|nr:MAG: hypothetical protein LQ338_006821 [Usnochroma carphineum]
MSDFPQNTLSDIFSDSPPASPSSTTPRLTEPSDIPRLRSTHVTNGYRDGIASSKDQALQPGFDEAYPLGAILGLRAGYILGVLEGLCSAYPSGNPALAETDEKKRDELVEVRRDEANRLKSLLIQAREELSAEKLFSKEYWSSEGLWAYEVGQKDEDVTFWQVADQHPMIRKWLERVRDEVPKAGIRDAEEGFVGIGEAPGRRAQLGSLQVDVDGGNG